MKTSTNPWITALISIMLSAFFVLINSDSTSPFFLNHGLDSSIFQYMGFAITKGKIPYTDLFDHKGLLLYWLNSAGYLLSSSWGVCLLQILSLSVTICLWYKLLEGDRPEWLKWAVIILSLLALYAYYDNGNMTEEWSLPFISYPFVIYCHNLKRGSNRFTQSQLIFIGLCMGCLALMRVNNMSPIVGLLLYCLIVAMKRKEYGYLACSIGIIASSACLPLLLAIGYMGTIGGVQGIRDMFFATITFNMEYSVGRNNLLLFNLWNNIRYIYKALLPIIFLLPVISRERTIALPLLLSFLSAVVSTGGGRNFHYLMIFIPLLVVSFSCLRNTRFCYLTLLLTTIIYGKTLLRQFDADHFRFPLKDERYEAFAKVISPIPPSERNKVWNMGGGFLVQYFTKADMVQTNRLLLPFQLRISPALHHTEVGCLQRRKPEYVIVADYHEDWMCDAISFSKADEEPFIKEHYELIASSCWEDGTQLFCYRRRQ